MPPWCLLQWHRLGWQPTATGWQMEAGQLGAKPPQYEQRPTGELLDVDRGHLGLHDSHYRARKWPTVVHYQGVEMINKMI